jgi:hypothetical protein
MAAEESEGIIEFFPVQSSLMFGTLSLNPDASPRKQTQAMVAIQTMAAVNKMDEKNLRERGGQQGLR